MTRQLTEEEWDATYKRPWPFPDKQRAGRCPHGVVPSHCADCSEPVADADARSDKQGDVS